MAKTAAGVGATRMAPAVRVAKMWAGMGTTTMPPEVRAAKARAGVGARTTAALVGGVAAAATTAAGDMLTPASTTIDAVTAGAWRRMAPLPAAAPVACRIADGAWPSRLCQRR